VSTVEQLEGERLVHTMPLSASSELRARLYTFNDVLRADIRLFAYRKTSAEWVPTGAVCQFRQQSCPSSSRLFRRSPKQTEGSG
jgi:hypothetical protein